MAATGGEASLIEIAKADMVLDKGCILLQTRMEQQDIHWPIHLVCVINCISVTYYATVCRMKIGMTIPEVTVFGYSTIMAIESGVVLLNQRRYTEGSHPAASSAEHPCHQFQCPPQIKFE